MTMHRPIDPPHGAGRCTDAPHPFGRQRPSVRMRLVLIVSASLALWIGIAGLAGMAIG